MKLRTVLTKEEIEQPGAYIFWLGDVCQYVGGSKHCIARAAEEWHDARHKWRKKGLAYDRVEFRFTGTEEAARELEEVLADILKPKYGKHKPSTSQK